MSRDLIVFGEDWGRHPSSTQHLMKRLAEDRKVIWINSIGMRRPKFTPADFARLGNKVWSMFGNKTKAPTVPIPKNMTVIEPRVIPLPGNPVAAKINGHVLGKAVRKAMNDRGFKTPVIWTSLPTAVDLLGISHKKAVVYYCGDEFGALAGVDHSAVLACEDRLSEKADLILAASEPLAAKFSSIKTKLIPHGVDFELFAHPKKRAAELPEKGLVAGFYGSLSEWLDQDLVVKCARLLPNWSFVFIGEERVDVSRLRKEPNIRLFGAIPHEDLPGYAQHWDVSIMPFVDNRQIQNCNPLKLREYLAAGRPVVATPFPALKGYSDLLYKAETAEAFSDAIIMASEEDPVIRDLRQFVVGSESWSARAHRVGALIDAL